MLPRYYVEIGYEQPCLQESFPANYRAPTYSASFRRSRLILHSAHRSFGIVKTRYERLLAHRNRRMPEDEEGGYLRDENPV